MQDLNSVMFQSAEAFKKYRKFSGKQKAAFLRAIAEEIEALGMDLIHTAMQEANLPEARLMGERGRTTSQLKMFADLLEEGSWVDARIDTAKPDRQPLPKMDLRKMLIPIGPVVVFGASNFPFAFSTAGGDTASALASGCPVVVKGHPGHAKTSLMVAGAIERAAERTGMPQGVFAHVDGGEGFEVGKALVMHPQTKAVAFTGSFGGGKTLFDMANQRPEPIPAFSEMGSINPVVLMPEKMSQDAENVALIYAGSITVGVGQFCTNPGLIIGIEGTDLEKFLDVLSEEIEKIAPGTMLNPGIFKNYDTKRAIALAQDGVITESVSKINKTAETQGTPTVASVSGDIFLTNPTLHQEVFGPYSLVVKCMDMAQLTEVLGHLEGQLTATLMATENDLKANEEIVDALRNMSGRLNFNNVPTGVEVCYGLQHGGPFPSTTDGRFTSVGPDAIKRFVRPATYQSFPEGLLPDELKTANPLNIWRMVDNEFVK
jgi:2,5-dioxopentanoate dehydrogenase